MDKLTMDENIIKTKKPLRRRSSIFSLLKRQKKLTRQCSEPGEEIYSRKFSMDSAILTDYRNIENSIVVQKNLEEYKICAELASAASDTDSEGSRAMVDAQRDDPALRRQDVLARIQSLYVEDPDREIGVAGELVEEVAEENKSLLWFLLKQVRPGMDLSKVVLPTFILEPRSFLDKLSDNYYHADILGKAQSLEDPYQRFKCVLRWYLSGLYRNSTSAILEGCARIHLLNWGETYITTAPYAHCKGIVIGTLSMELGGKVHIICQDTGYQADVEFKLRSFLGGADQTNAISGRIKKGKDTIASVEGYWDGKIEIKDKRTGEESNLLDVNILKEQRMPRYLMKLDNQQEFESQKLWIKVSEAILNDDQVAATEQKTIIEEAQRARARNLLSPWVPRLFRRDSRAVPEGIIDQGWRYNHANTSPWQPEEIVEYEEEFVISSALRRTERPREPPPPSDSDSRDELARRSKTSTGRDALTFSQELFSLSEIPRPHRRHASSGSNSNYSLMGASRRPNLVLFPFPLFFLEMDLPDERMHGKGKYFLSVHPPPSIKGRQRMQLRMSMGKSLRYFSDFRRTLKQALIAIDTSLREQSIALERLTRTVELFSESHRIAEQMRPSPRPVPYSHAWDMFAGFILAMLVQVLINWLF
ncbi:Oxysterol-binding protein-related protein 8 [Papilio xuthus]|uniref:Oxysterol-binding protein-related protein 8 n=1 Tax=Papilio xuthus TaxID=66420 RepID=A0A194Q557_PAPXU|nr:Oxysterol-binding protein-related protein 8 [Papilio xuthus]